MGYSFEIITGPMSCGKTEELLRRIKRCIIAQKKVRVFSPALDTRSKGDYIESRNGLWLDAMTVKTAKEILHNVDEQDQVVAIDEIQFFDDEIVGVVSKLASQGKRVIASGLDLDFKGEPFGAMPELLCIADKVDKLTAVCMKCGSDHATRTQRLLNGFPADKSSPLIMIGGDETYEARCLKCYELPDKVAEAKKKSFRLLDFSSLVEKNS
jgi:thymidine kinase